MALIDVLIPTYGRKTGLAIVLSSLLGQTFRDFDVIISDQSDESYLFDTDIQALVDALEWHGHTVSRHHHIPRRGMAEQRHFLLEQSRAPYVNFLDDDVIVDPPVMRRLLDVLRAEGCGFVGAAAVGLKYLPDERPHQQNIDVWEGPVRPEPFEPATIPWERGAINVAANPLHLERKLVPDGRVVRYKVVWIGGANVLYDREKLLNVGGFSWWDRLPPVHAGEEVLTQWLLIRKFGGCGIIPSGTYHLLLPTTIEDRTIEARDLFGALIEEFDVHPVRPVEPLRRDTAVSA